MRILSRSFSVLPVLLVATAAIAQNQVVLKTQLPPPLFVGTPAPFKVPNLEPATRGKRPDFYVPAGTINLAKNKKVIVINADKVKVSGRKEEDKMYRHFTGYPGGLVEKSLKRVRAEKPVRLIED